jgi:hypothetical protein
MEQELATPYDLALRFAVERLVLLLEDTGQSAIQLIAEARGKREDHMLRRHLLRLPSSAVIAENGLAWQSIQFA